MKIKDISSSMSILPAEVELAVPVGEYVMGQKLGGLQTYSNKFKRGYGDAVFGSDENGIWLGAAEFADAPFRVDLQGNMYFQTADGAIVIDAVNKRIVFYEGTTPVGFIGFQTGAF